MRTFALILLLMASAMLNSTAQKASQKPLQERYVYETYIREITFTNKHRNAATVRTFTPNGERITEEHYEIYSQGIKHGLTRCWYPNGQTYWSSDFKHGETHGPLLVYYPDGSPKRREYFRNGQSRESHCFDISGQPITCDPFARPATYVGTDKEFLAQFKQKLAEVGYVPDNTRHLVSIKGIMLDDGQLTDIVVVLPGDVNNQDSPKKIGQALMLMPRWQPASVDNNPIPTHYVLSLVLAGREVHLIANDEINLRRFSGATLSLQNQK